jgi:hypothetical protein
MVIESIPKTAGMVYAREVCPTRAIVYGRAPSGGDH